MDMVRHTSDSIHFSIIPLGDGKNLSVKTSLFFKGDYWLPIFGRKYQMIIQFCKAHSSPKLHKFYQNAKSLQILESSLYFRAISLPGYQGSASFRGK